MTTAQDIKDTIQALAKLENAKKHYQLLSDSIANMRSELAEKSLQLSKEQDDIEELEKLSITSVFHKVLGNKEQLLEKERQEYLTLAMKIKELKKSIELSEFESNVVKEKAMTSDQLLQNLEALKVTRLNEIINYNEASKGTMLNVLHDIDDCNRYSIELKEAHSVGESCMQYTQMTLQKLQEAINYGEWDMMGQNTADYSKRMALDQAARAAYNAQRNLQIYNKELLDIGISDASLHINFDAFATFTDTFFDNLITDWIVQKKIKNTYAQVKDITEKISNIQSYIVNKIAENESKISDLEALKDKIILAS